jgi:soluble lytic murein transglycosylase-like protein
MVAGLVIAIRWGLLRVAGVLVVAIALTAGLIPGLAGGGSTGGPLAAGAPVPAAYRPWIERAGSRCPQISPALIAAQLSAESGFNPNARGAAGELGIAQFMRATWESWKGTAGASPLDPEAAIDAQGRFMCHLAGAAQAGVDRGQLHGNVSQLALAAYNAGFDAVQAAGGLPAIPSTRAYVARITALAGRYADPTRL